MTMENVLFSEKERRVTEIFLLLKQISDYENQKKRNAKWFVTKCYILFENHYHGKLAHFRHIREKR